eukprot:8242187-Lingulodinium_polyedra.AAC.1
MRSTSPRLSRIATMTSMPSACNGSSWDNHLRSGSANGATGDPGNGGSVAARPAGYMAWKSRGFLKRAMYAVSGVWFAST